MGTLENEAIKYAEEDYLKGVVSVERTPNYEIINAFPGFIKTKLKCAFIAGAYYREALLAEGKKFDRQKETKTCGNCSYYLTDVDKKLYDKAEELFCQNCKLRTEQCLFAYRKVNGIEDCRKSCGCEEVPAWIDGYQKGQKDFMAAAEPIGKALYDMARDVAEDVKWHYPSKGELPNCTRQVLICFGMEERMKFVYWRADLGTFGSALPTEITAWRYIEPPKEEE